MPRREREEAGRQEVVHIRSWDDTSRTRSLYTARGNLIDEHPDTCTRFGEAKDKPPHRPRRCLAGCWILRLLASAVLAASCAPFAMAFHAVRQCLPLAARTKYTANHPCKGSRLADTVRRGRRGQFNLRLRGRQGQAANGATGLGMLMEVGSQDAASLYLCVAGSLAGAEPLLLMDKNTFNLAIGAFSGMVASAAVFPLDTAKTRIQMATDDAVKKNTFQTLQFIVETEGVGALYRGIVPVVVGAAPESAVQLSVFEFMKSVLLGSNMLHTDSAIVAAFLAGSVAGTAQMVVTCPLEVLKITAQTRQGPPRSTLDLISELGPAGLFRGWQATLLRDIPYAAIYFPLYIAAKASVAPLLPNPLAAAMVSGLAAGMFTAGITTPADVIKTNVQTYNARVARLAASSHATSTPHTPASTPPPLLETPSVMSTAERIYAKNGLGGFLTGLDARLSRHAPAQGVCLCVFEFLKQIFSSKVKIGSVSVGVSADVSGVKYYSDGQNAGEGLVTGLSRTALETARLSEKASVEGITWGQSVLATWNDEFAPLPEAMEAVKSMTSSSTMSSLTQIDVHLSSQSAGQAAAALSQNVVDSVVVQLGECGALYFTHLTPAGLPLSYCMNQAIHVLL